MIGAILGDIVGAPYEFDNCKRKAFPLFDPNTLYTDDTVIMTGPASTVFEGEISLPLEGKVSPKGDG